MAMGGQAAERAGDNGRQAMEPAVLRETWARVAQRLRAELGDDLFTSWFGRMEPESFVDGVLAASVPTRFLKSWIENHYVGKLLKIGAGEFAGLRQVQVRVRVQGTAAQPAAVSRSVVPPPRAGGEATALQPMGSFLPQAAEAALARAPRH
jgi:chromosomal replication initiator protein